jgi:hypothetical protein
LQGFINNGCCMIVISILSNYLSGFERIPAVDCERPLMRPT